MSGLPTRTIAVWCPDWPVVAACAVNGVSPHRPAAVLVANRVLACSAAARADGVRRGLRKREAQSRCPELVVFDDDPDRDARVFEPVVCAVEALSPGVEMVRAGLVVVAARGPAGYYGGEEAAAERIIDQVAAEADVECQVGIAEGIFAATLAAHRGVIVDAGRTPGFLASLNITELLQPGGTAGRRRQDLVGLLRRLGLRTLGAFGALPIRDVASRFGADAVLAHRLARGEDERPLVRRRPPVDLAVTQQLDPPVERVDAAAFAAREPAARLHELLAERGLACTRLEVHAETEHGEELIRTWRCAEPLTPSGINDRVRWQLDAWITAGARRGTGPSGGIVLLRLVPAEVMPVGALQRSLWGEVGDGDERASRAMVRVQGLLGPESVFTAVLGGGRDPAQRVRLVPWGDERTPDRPTEPPWPGRLPPPSPATVFPAASDDPAGIPAPRDPAGADGAANPDGAGGPTPPVGRVTTTVTTLGSVSSAGGSGTDVAPFVDVLDEVGRPVGVTARALLTAPPHRVTVVGEPTRVVVDWAGPWPVEERWWEPDGGRRRARLQVTVRDGPALLLACENSRWRVEGIYD